MKQRANLISPTDLLELIQSEKPHSIVDASWYLPTQNRDAKAEYALSRIASTQHFDIDAIADLTSSLPHTMPDENMFEAAMEAMGVSDTHTIVVYDGPGLFSSARAWFMLRAFGAKDVRVLEGGFDRWKKKGLPCETGKPRAPIRATFAAKLDESLLPTWQEILANAQGTNVQIVDARSHERFSGTAPEPREGLRAGHIPGSISLPYNELVQDGSLKPDDELRAVFDTHGIDFAKPIVTTCGSGVTAAVIALALDTLGVSPVQLYDGSWAEWGSREDLPIATTG